jgi:serine/threonine protein kinase
MGIVLKARQLSLNRAVALKMILTGRLESPDFVPRFRNEAEAAASLEHPSWKARYRIGLAQEAEGDPQRHRLEKLLRKLVFDRLHLPEKG